MTEILKLTSRQTVAIVGCGGKTSLLFQLGSEWRDRRVLISATTKIGRPDGDRWDYLYTSPETWQAPNPGSGIHLMGAALGCKLSNIPLPQLEQLRKGFDLTLLECDGSRRLPLKGWREDEPVVPPFADVTIGVAVLRPLGQPVTEERVFQLPLFCEITGAAPGEPLKLHQLAASITHPQGLFHNARGRRILLLNQVEDSSAFATAKALCALLPRDLTVIAGSLRQNVFKEMQQ